MYSQIAGAGAAAGVPTLLAATGVAGPELGVLLGVAVSFIVIGIAMLRRFHQPR